MKQIILNTQKSTTLSPIITGKKLKNTKAASKDKTLSELSKKELMKKKRFFNGKSFIQVPSLDPEDPFSALAIKCIVLTIERVKKKLKKCSHSSFDILFLNSFDLTDKAMQFLSEIDALNKSSFALIRKKMISEVEKILDLDIKNMNQLLNPNKLATGLIDKISSQHSKIEQDIIVLLCSRSSPITELLDLSNETEKYSIAKIIDALEVIHSVSKIRAALDPTSSIFDSGFIEIASSGIVNADAWHKVILQFNPDPTMLDTSKSQSTSSGWFEWQKSYRPSKSLNDVFLPEKTKNVIKFLVDDYKENSKDKRLVFVFKGPPGTGKTMTSEAIAESLGMTVLRIQVGEMESENIPNIVAYAIARAKNKKFMLLFEECEHLLWKSFYHEIASPWMKILFEDFKGVACFTTNYEIPTDFLRRATFSVKFNLPTGKARAKILENEISSVVSDQQINLQMSISEISEIAGKYNIPGGFFSQALQIASAFSQDKSLNSSSLNEAFKLVESQLMDGNTRSIPNDPKVSLNELKTDEFTTQKLTQFIKYCAAHSDEQSLGGWAPKTILFSGPPGTGKTMAAEAIAKSLNKKILRVSPSHLLGKYVGETEKNIRELFKNSKSEEHIIFIDEAEGLLIDRQSSNASWERTQADEFLQQIEDYKGILIAATNITSMIDPAYARRFVFHIKFKVPDSTVRLLLWENYKSMLPFNLDFRYLAEKFDLSGGEIRNIAIKTVAYELQTQNEVAELCEQQMQERTGIITKRIGIN